MINEELHVFFLSDAAKEPVSCGPVKEDDVEDFFFVYPPRFLNFERYNYFFAYVGGLRPLED